MEAANCHAPWAWKGTLYFKRIGFAKILIFITLKGVGNMEGKIQYVVLVDWQTLVKSQETCSYASCMQVIFTHLLAPLFSTTIFLGSLVSITLERMERYYMQS